ncbi:hypothetical protein [Synechococcus elongatus]|uniref:Uncharacterized protein n=1 Tax=Synechococcus elongatus (strain ATCC 33912 / PCC 7942 / FACHB-805) TaxID=1140 RepID=Q31MZ2_SYNE7|nr:hypothetical protein [Synechococcus elongatus]ABB57577.1 hypothetical protein Synpcc7942_1547 [Synechococcus elongatus PCC 7942 = FACHB-805]AJD58888.1 hypothetical protein M744_08730 [Synechococcus elongatus UTEX 2973]MBD2588378.1 hypothetical protein [Synechococcus elongatus FACHB-242]MBD2689459.1 hypothetical protein [Synechococcus elongatus FACHB-1061]MBD2708122.1 hypothetical protein [Synechococcus elongatus PCC 7942 = FACHB-805]
MIIAMHQSKLNEEALILEAERKTTSLGRLTELAQSRLVSVRASVAGNIQTPVAVLESLSADHDYVVHCAVAENRKTPIIVLKKLAFDANQWVRNEVRENPNTPIEIKESIDVHGIDDFNLNNNENE